MRIRNVLNIAIDVLTLVAIGVGLFLLIRNTRQTPAQTTSYQMEVDSTPPAFGVTDGSEGAAKRTLGGPSARPILLFVFKSDCPACGAQKPAWDSIASLASRFQVEVLALTPEELNDPVRAYFTSPVVQVRALTSPAEGFAAMSTKVVPTTVLLDRSGRIAFHETGVLNEQAHERLQELLSHTLTGRRN